MLQYSREITVYSTVVITGGCKMTLNYMLKISEKHIDENDKHTTTVYGVKVESYGEDGQIIDEFSINDISSELGVVVRLIEKLKAGKVTPMSVMDIIEDYM